MSEQTVHAGVAVIPAWQLRLTDIVLPTRRGQARPASHRDPHPGPRRRCASSSPAKPTGCRSRPANRSPSQPETPSEPPPAPARRRGRRGCAAGRLPARRDRRALTGSAGSASREPQRRPGQPRVVSTDSANPQVTAGADGSRLEPAGISGPFPTGCRASSGGRGQPLPDPRCTPGAVDTAVTQASLLDTVCRRGGYTSSVRPPRQVTDAAKRRMLAAYGMPRSQSSKVELDHLVPLALGGSSDVRNLWPEPNRLTAGHTNLGGYAANDKDIVEVYLFHAVCTRKAQLTAAQNAIAGDWTTAVAVLHLPPIPAGYQG